MSKIILGGLVLIIVGCASVPVPVRTLYLSESQERSSYLPPGSSIYNIPIGDNQYDPGNYPWQIIFGTLDFADPSVRLEAVVLERRAADGVTEVTSNYVSGSTFAVFDQPPDVFFLKKIIVFRDSQRWILSPPADRKYFLFKSAENTVKGLQYTGRKGWLYCVFLSRTTLGLRDLSTSRQTGEFVALDSTRDYSYTEDIKNWAADPALYRWRRLLEMAPVPPRP